MTLVQCDLSQAELRAMAIMSDDPWLINALQEGAGDFFDTHMMPVVFPGVDRTAWTAQEAKDQRAKCKGIVYGLAFGRGSAAIADALDMPTAEAQAIIDNLFKAAPKWNEWRESVKRAAVRDDMRDILITPLGRQYQSEVVTPNNEWKIKNEALSFLPQSTASDICLMTAIRLHPVIKGMGAHIVALVHDAILVECPDDKTATKIGELISTEFRYTGEIVLGDKVPMLSEWSIGNSWGELK